MLLAEEKRNLITVLARLKISMLESSNKKGREVEKS